MSLLETYYLIYVVASKFLYHIGEKVFLEKLPNLCKPEMQFIISFVLFKATYLHKLSKLGAVY